MVTGPDAALAATTSATADIELQIVNLHGDVAATIDTTLTAPALRYFDEFGVPTTGQTGSAEIMEQVDPIFYGDPKTAAMKVLGGP